ncbi:hypothetical protein JTE90_023140 [Oedothorax gibbosus]|uniref:HTH CENPB-type domain-containing protein n=1 Tax=Oedothorax gibbosus TaxID=931172 RepID=A0AAV6UQK0_9ARAC|nr:hypothetical protein JTE90_023140 [Oedothorax gibbosus]
MTRSESPSWVAKNSCSQKSSKLNFVRGKVTQMAGKKWLAAFLKRDPLVAKRKSQKLNPGRAQKPTGGRRRNRDKGRRAHFNTLLPAQQHDSSTAALGQSCF